MQRHIFIIALLAAAALSPRVGADDKPLPAPQLTGYAPVHAILARHCIACHDSKEAEGGLILESHAALMKGGDTGPALLPGKPDDSLLVKLIEHKEKPFMPPPKKADKLSQAEVALIRDWIKAGAPAPKPGELAALALAARPQVAPKGTPRRPIQALAYEPKAKLIAVARPNEVELIHAESRSVVRRLTGIRGHVNKVAFFADGGKLAAAAGVAGLGGEVRIWNLADAADKPARVIEAHGDAIYGLAISSDHKTLATGSYDQKIMLWNLDAPARTAIASAAITSAGVANPDTTAGTGASTDPGLPLRILTGHNGGVFDLAFRNDNKVLASASIDRTVKLWSVGDGARLDTLSEGTQAQHVVAFTADGKRLLAAGVDNRIRAWSVSAQAKEGTNPISIARFAHEGAIQALALSQDGTLLATSADDRTVKLWNAADVSPKLALEKQPDWPTALCFALDGKALVVGRLDGSLAFYDTKTGAAIAAPKPPPAPPASPGPSAPPAPPVPPAPPKPIKPELSSIWPAGLQRGVGTQVRLTGKALAESTLVKFSDGKLSSQGGLVPVTGAAAAGADVWIAVPEDVAPGVYDIWLANEAGESAKLKLHIDTLPQAVEAEPNDDAAKATSLALPASAWGKLTQRGDVDHYAFDGKAGQTIVIDIASQRIGSKMDALLTLVDATGRVLASNNDFEGSPDSLIAHKLPADGRYTVQVRDLQLNGSVADHVYRVTIGEVPLVTGVFPLSVPAGKEATVQLLGFNLPADAAVKLSASAGGEVSVPIDAGRFRARRALSVLATTEMSDGVESEPNDEPVKANVVSVPGVVNGRIHWVTGSTGNAGRPALTPALSRGERGPEPSVAASATDATKVNSATSSTSAAASNTGDADLFRFTAKAGQRLVIETMAARRGSPVDTKIQVLHAPGAAVDSALAGKPVERVKLRAVRDTVNTFRPVDSNANGARLVNWEEMEQNDFLYMNGEVVKLFLPPRGPDSQWDFYTLGGKRRCYFDTSPTAHALDEPCYIVEPLPPSAPLPPPNGLPVYSLPYANDDDGDRQLGSDSRLIFTAPADGDYLVRVTDTRGFGGEDFAYRLIIREAKPDFTVALVGPGGANPTVPAGSGAAFSVVANRIDGFEGEIKVQIAGVPQGFIVSNPLLIEAGHFEAKGTIFALPLAEAKDAKTQAVTPAPVAVTATAIVDGKPVTKSVNSIGTIKPGPKPALLVSMTPEPLPKDASSDPTKPMEITLIPGQMTTARLKLDRVSHKDIVSFDVDNLPHGVIVADIGLNGVLIRADENERVIFIQCAPWVADMDRLCHARAREAGNPTTLPVLIKVRRGR